MERIPYIQCLLFLVHFGAYFCLDFKSETETVKGRTVKLVCSIEPSSFTMVISLFKDGNFKTSCDNANACSPASTDSNRYQYTSNSSTVAVEISSLNHTSDEGAWRCTIGGSSSDYTLVVQSIPSTLTLQTIPVANVTKDISDVQVSATCYCIYPAVTEIDILYRTKPTKDFKVLERIPPASLSTTANPGHSCLAHEFQITVSNYSVSVENNPEALSNQNDVYFKVQFGNSITSAVGPFDFIVKAGPPGGSTIESALINLSTDVGTTINTETSTKLSTESLSSIQSSVSLSDKSTIEGNTLSGSTESVNTKSEISTVPVTTSPSGLSEEMIIIISTVSAVGGILLIVIIVIVVLCCKQRTGTTDKMKIKNKHDKLQATNRKNKDLNSNYNQPRKNKYESRSKMRDSTSTNLNKKHPQNDIWFGDRMPMGVEFSKSQKYHQQNYIPRNQHHYRNQNSAYCLPYTDLRNVMYYQSEYNEDMLGYSRAGPYRMQQFYPKSYPRQDRYTEDGLERRIGHRRGQYEGYWDNDTLY